MATAEKKPTKALETSGVVKKGHFKLGMWGAKRGSPKQKVHDGDTVGLNTALNFSSRFLGIDAPEVSFTIKPDDRTFVGIGNPKWTAFWSSPSAWKKGLNIKPTLLKHLTQRIGDGMAVAANHEKYAKQAEEELTAMILADQQASGTDDDTFEFFLAFAYEILDQYGRMLCYLNAERAIFKPPAQANELSYNERLLGSGAVVPYFIFPNLQPFMKGRPFAAEAIKPDGFWSAVDGASKLRNARQAVASARAANRGVFSKVDPLRLLPYEIRYLARASSTGPDRYVIDLGKHGSTRILEPQKYISIKNVEDRLFVPREFVPLFVLNGWKVGSST